MVMPDDSGLDGKDGQPIRAAVVAAGAAVKSLAVAGDDGRDELVDDAVKALDPRGVLIGIVGAVIGGFLGSMLFNTGGVSGIDLRSILIAVVGAMVLLWVYRMATRRKTV